MAEFCEECMKKYLEIPNARVKYILSDNAELCEGCGQMRRIVVTRRESRWRRVIRKLDIREKNKGYHAK